MKLSILIPTLYERNDQLITLKSILYGQIYSGKFNEHVEVLTEADNREITTGTKRNILLNRAKGDYIVFCDDDDKVHKQYVRLILKAIESGPDAVGIRLIHYLNSSLYGNTCHSILYKEWKNIPGPEGIWTFQRCPNHLNPVKREHALRARFPDKTIGEDRDYSYKLRKYLKTEVMIEEPIYFYMERKK